MNSTVRLRLKNLLLNEDFTEPVEFAVLSSSVFVLLGDDNTIAPQLARTIAGHKKTHSGSILVGEDRIDVTNTPANNYIGFVPFNNEFPPGITVREYLTLTTAFTGLSRTKQRKNINQTLLWCSLKESSDIAIADMSSEDRYMVSFASVITRGPGIIVLQGPFPKDLYPLIEMIANGNYSVIASLPNVKHIPQNTERIAICGTNNISAIVTPRKLADAEAELQCIHVSFFPALPRRIIENMANLRSVTGTEDGYMISHSSIASAVISLVNMARANSRTITNLELFPPTVSDLYDYFKVTTNDNAENLFD